MRPLALGRDTAKGIKDGGYSLGQVAEALARLDLPAALKVIEDLERDVRKNEKSDRSSVFERFLGHIAYKLAARSPADAERVLERMPDRAEHGSLRRRGLLRGWRRRTWPAPAGSPRPGSRAMPRGSGRMRWA